MKEYRELIEVLVKMAEISRPEADSPSDDRNAKRFKKIQHGICDLMEDAAVAIDDLLNKLETTKDEGWKAKGPERGSAGDSVSERDRAMCDLCA